MFCVRQLQDENTGLHATVGDLRTDNQKLEAERDQVPSLQLPCVAKLWWFAFGNIVCCFARLLDSSLS
jgi:hypothetical protein